MSHIPINHPLRPLYRTLALLTGVFVLVFGVVGYFASNDRPLFEQDDVAHVFGLGTNLAFSLLSVVAGVALIVATVLGRNIDKWVYLIGGVAFLAIGMAALTLLRTDLNYLAFEMANVIVSFLIGMVLFAAALYGKSGSSEESAAEEAFRHRGNAGAAH
jgi:hypothetical protein